MHHGETSETECDFKEIGPRIFALEVRGALGRHLDSRLFDAAAKIRTLGVEGVALDLSKGEHLDGAGLIGLFRFGYMARQNNLSAALFGTGADSLEILRRLDLGEVLPLFSSRENALRALGVKTTESAEDESAHEICAVGEWLGEFGPVRKEELPPGDPGINVLGRNMQGPTRGYGNLVRKLYTARLCKPGLTTEETTTALRTRIGEFWPEGNLINFKATGITPGAVGTIRLSMPGGAPLATGVRVVHAGSSNFTFAPLEGHMASGFINFSAFEEEGCQVIRICSMARTGDPFFDVGFRLFGHTYQEKFWKDTLARAAAAFKVPAEVHSDKEYVDSNTVSTGWANTFRNAAVLTPFGLVASSVRSLFGGK